ncbi:MAG: zinc ribbon domain-containing protein [Ruminococcus sp.]|nr:zinc ribbon domain-containing protein [Ruminococcus sp.]
MGKFDEIFDDVVVNAKAAASAVSKKASSMYDTSKHKITAAELRGEINKKLKDLGALTYKTQVHGTDLSAEVSTLVSEITELKDNLYIINNHIASAKNQKKCPECDADVPKNSNFCNICGAKIEEAPVETEAADKAQDVVENVTEAAADIVDEAVDAVDDAVNEVSAATEQAAAGAAEIVDEAVDSIGGLDAE